MHHALDLAARLGARVDQFENCRKDLDLCACLCPDLHGHLMMQICTGEHSTETELLGVTFPICGACLEAVEEASVRAAVSVQWAEDWLSEEDGIYDGAS